MPHQVISGYELACFQAYEDDLIAEGYESEKYTCADCGESYHPDEMPRIHDYCQACWRLNGHEEEA